MVKKISRAFIIIPALLIGLYPGIYFLIDRKFGLLSSKPEALLNDVIWNVAFYLHIILGGIALLVGWSQFINKWRVKYIHLHKTAGKVYVICVCISAVAGFYIAFFTTTGWIAALGFMCLAMIWFYTTVSAYLQIRKKQLAKHQQMMIYSYAACFAAVTLRIWLPLLQTITGDFEISYKIVAWLCWIPNLIVANLIIRKMKIRTEALKL